eukprot:3903010-Lingulodinium_polyedra.AAC.1
MRSSAARMVVRRSPRPSSRVGSTRASPATARSMNSTSLASSTYSMKSPCPLGSAITARRGFPTATTLGGGCTRSP